ncbi:MAG: DNA primase, partial [Pseudomonadota bacterium]|nr:DNA primase [Pseudomonadota bacterium]
VLSAIEKMPQGVLKSLMLTELSRRTGVEQSRFEALLAPVVAEEPELMPFDDAMEPAVAEGQLPQRRRKSSAALGLMGRTLQLLVHEPRLVERLPESLEWCDGQGDDARLCRDVIELLRAGGYSSAQVLLMHFHGSEDGERLAALARKELLIPGPARAAELDGLVSYFQRACKTPSRQQEIDTLLAKQQSGERLSSEERSRLMSLLAARD